MGAPTRRGQALYLHGNCTDDQLRQGPLDIVVSVDGRPLAPAVVRPGETAFDLVFPLPDAAVGRQEMRVSIEVARTVRPPSDARDLGVAFGTFAVR